MPYAEGVLDERLAPRLREHLEHCGRCREELACIRQVSSVLKRAAAPAMEPNPALWAKLEARIATTARMPARRWSWQIASAAAAAALVLVIVGAAVNVAIKQPSDETYAVRPAHPERWHMEGIPSIKQPTDGTYAYRSVEVAPTDQGAKTKPAAAPERPLRPVRGAPQRVVPTSPQRPPVLRRPAPPPRPWKDFVATAPRTAPTRTRWALSSPIARMPSPSGDPTEDYSNEVLVCAPTAAAAASATPVEPEVVRAGTVRSAGRPPGFAASTNDLAALDGTRSERDYDRARGRAERPDTRGGTGGHIGDENAVDVIKRTDKHETRTELFRYP